MAKAAGSADAGALTKHGSVATHPHWRAGGPQQAKRLYANAKTAHAHTQVRPRDNKGRFGRRKGGSISDSNS